MNEPNDVTQDTVFQGRVKLVQPGKGLRATTDSLLLAASLDVKGGGHALELGAGSGGALLPAAWRLADVHFTGVEIDAALAGLAIQGISKNAFQGRVTLFTAEASAWAKDHENAFDAVFANPPFFEKGRISPPDNAKVGAYLESLSLKEWLKAMVFTAKPRAPITVLHRAAELARLLTPLDRWGGEITVLPIYSRPGQPANRVLVRLRKGLRRGDIRMLPGFIVYEDATSNQVRPAMQAIREGKALTWC
ncbi:MAG: methyltransferase [Pseudomonadota bacterium]